MAQNKRYDAKDASKSKSTGYSKSRGKGKGNSKSYDKQLKPAEATASLTGDNDPDWYIPDPETMELATRMSFSNFVGVKVELDPTRSIPSLDGATLKPGAAMQVFMNPSPGFTTIDDAKNAAINQQAFRLYARLSSINAKNTLYTPNDVTTIILAMGELIKMFALAQRAYGLLWTYNVRNRLMPGDLVSLSGVNVELLADSAADYLTTLNTLIVEANRIPFPSNIDYFRHCAEMYDSVYMDSESSMSELYIPIPYSTWDLEEDLILEGTVLKTHELWTSVEEFQPLDPTDLLNLIRDMIKKLLSSNSYNLVYSDIMNLAMKEGNVSILRFMPVSVEYSVAPKFDQEWLLKLNNSTIVGVPLSSDAQSLPLEHTPDNDVLPDKDILSLVYAPQWTRVDMPDLALQKIINFNFDAPDLKQRIIATRLMFGSGMYQAVMKSEPKEGEKDAVVGNWYTNQTVALCDHYIVGINVYTIYEKDKPPQYSTTQSSTDITTNDTPSILTRFSSHPYIYEYSMDLLEKPTLEGLVGDLDFFTTMDFDVLARINRLGLFALFDVRDVSRKA